MLAWRVSGVRVAFTRKVRDDTVMELGGCYQQYVIADALSCIPLPNSISYETGSMHFVNPITALGLTEKIYELKG